MKMHHTILSCLPCLLAVPLMAQPQIGGGVCTSATLNGAYSLTLSGRDVSSAVTFSNILQGIGTATFDGLNKVTFAFTSSTNKAFSIGQTWSGTYSMQSNCLGAINITTGDSASFILGSFNQGANYFITGQDGVYSILGSGDSLPASCSATTLSGVYAFNGNGFPLSTGTITGVNTISGLMTFDGTSAVTTNWLTTSNGTSKTTTTTGSYTVTAGCGATATVTDPSGNTYNLVFTLSSSNGAFVVNGLNSQLVFQASGRIL